MMGLRVINPLNTDSKKDVGLLNENEGRVFSLSSHFFLNGTIGLWIMSSCFAEFPLVWYDEIFSLTFNLFSVIQQHIVSLDSFHLFLVFRPRAGSPFKQDDV